MASSMRLSARTSARPATTRRSTIVCSLRGTAEASRRQLLLASTASLGLGFLAPRIALATDLPTLDPSIYGDAKAVAALEKSAKAALKQVITPENAGNLLRMAFHDAGTWDAIKQTGGADGSLRLELAQAENGGLKYGQAILERAKASIDGPITWADLYQLAGAEAVALTGGPQIKVALGRKDTDVIDPAGQLPSPTMSADELIDLFERNGYTTTDMVALSGAHTLGSSRKNKPKGPMELTPGVFDNSYFKLLLDGGGAFFSDKTLVESPKTRPIVEKYAKNQKAFFDDFRDAYIKMSLKGYAAA